MTCMGRALVRFNGVKERIRVQGPLVLPLLEVQLQWDGTVDSPMDCGLCVDFCS